ncbi:hypothetical protein [Virgibacillus dokdonensis]
MTNFLLHFILFFGYSQGNQSQALTLYRNFHRINMIHVPGVLTKRVLGL